ncbi:hypothetical protein D11S_2284 (plasmid) [Aggregatibacter actinomycetemcomitans D11S-1]|uniref:hypothetical protein n=1 Tax=Aggregatibacter actinomycetemcomitans TaxID=714 RepID=UPI0001BA1528|nr:hypothetical protein [Aggregatibacter actinomycetemcomitans]ACX80357.1 hypothetical protein D11S_2284 [Aggregatibacter actinomycetemcomitans D11S-1]
MKKIALFIMCFSLVACGEKVAQKKEDNVVKQPFSLSEKPQTETTKSEIKQPFSLSSEPQTKSK